MFDAGPCIGMFTVMPRAMGVEYPAGDYARPTPAETPRQRRHHASGDTTPAETCLPPPSSITWNSMNRRQFLKRSSATLLASAAATYVPTSFAAEKTRRVGLIGAGWYGKSDLWRLVQVAPVEIVSICDPDKHMLAGAVEIASQRQKSRQRPRTYGDYREMLKEKDLEIVLVGSPDHWHALHAIAAMEAGADVYCQKPISRDVREGEAMLDAADRKS